MVQKMAALQQMMTAMLMQMTNMQKNPNQCKRCMEKRLGKPYCT